MTGIRQSSDPAREETHNETRLTTSGAATVTAMDPGAVVGNINRWDGVWDFIPNTTAYGPVNFLYRLVVP